MLLLFDGHLVLDVLMLLDIYYLIDTQMNPGERNNYAIQCASYYGHIDIVTLLLLDTWVDPSDMQNNAMKCNTIVK